MGQAPARRRRHDPVHPRIPAPVDPLGQVAITGHCDPLGQRISVTRWPLWPCDPLGLMMTRWVNESAENRPHRLEWYADDIAQARARIDDF